MSERSTELTVTRTPLNAVAQARASKDACQYLEYPQGDPAKKWGPRTTLAGKVGSSAAAALADQWHATYGTPAPKTLVSRVSRVAKQWFDFNNDAEWSVRVAKAIPQLAGIYQDAYRASYGEAPPSTKWITATLAAAQLTAEKMNYVVIQKAILACAGRGDDRILDMYIRIKGQEEPNSTRSMLTSIGAKSTTQTAVNEAREIMRRRAEQKAA